MSSEQSLPAKHRALVLGSSYPPTVETIPTPLPTPGSAIVRIINAAVVSYMREVYDGTRKYPYPTPLVIGTSAIGRVAATGPDATALKPGQLVFIDCTVRSRDDETDIFLSGLHEGYTEGSKKLMHGEWKDSTFAEYAKVPLENCFILDEKRLCGRKEDGGLGYRLEDLAHLSRMVVPYGGLRDIDLRVGETIIVTPATGGFGGAAVQVALAMGAKVIAMGRNVEALKRIKKTSDKVETVQMTPDVEADTATLKKFGRIDAFFDISPPAAGQAPHFKSCINALRHSARISLMGGMRGDVPIPHSTVMHKNMRLIGTWMYSRQQVKELIKMVEIGALELGESERTGLRVVSKHGLDDWEGAFAAAEKNAGMGQSVVITP
jgi:threonine dehydrogenase-like Zn-dependent dehydrogenase